MVLSQGTEARYLLQHPSLSLTDQADTEDRRQGSLENIGNIRNVVLCIQNRVEENRK